MFNKKYKKGMADAAKAYEAFGQKQADAIKHILEEVRQGKRDLESVVRELNGNIDGLYNYIDSKEKAHLYSLYTPFDIIELDKNNRLFLVGVLYRLTADKTPNENQQNYIRAVQRYLEIKEPPFGIDPMYIETIEDIPTQKAILQTVLEYLYLQDGDSYDETEYQQEFLDAFSVNTKGRKEIMDHIDLLYTATGAKGLAEKYGYVPEEETFGEEGIEESDGSRTEQPPTIGQYEWNYKELSENQIADIYDEAPFINLNGKKWCAVLCETESYYIYSETINREPANRRIKSFHKTSCEVKDITHAFSGFYNAESGKLYVRGGGDLFPHQYDSIQSAYICKDTLFYDDNIGSIFKYDIEKDEIEKITEGLLPKLLNKEICGRGGWLESPWIPFLKDGKLSIIHSETKEKKTIRYEGVTVVNAFSITAFNNFITFFAKIPSRESTCLCCYDVISMETTLLVGENDGRKRGFFSFGTPWSDGALFSICHGTVCYEHIRSDCMEVAKVTFEDGVPMASVHKFPSDTRSGTGTEFFVDKDFVGFISSENNKNLYVFNKSENEFRCVADRCGGDSYFDQRLYRIGNYIYMCNFHTGTTQYRISMDQTNQKKLIL